MIRYKVPDKKNALSMIEAAKNDLDYTLTLEPTDQSSTTIIRNIYESFRMLGEALLIAKGIKSEDHITPINNLIKLNVQTPKSINILDNLRKLRHGINYYGYRPTKAEAEDSIELAKTCFNILYEEVKKQIIK